MSEIYVSVKMNRAELVEWLLENGGPSIRYRTACELTSRASDAGQQTELLNSPLVRTWLENLRPELSFNQLHGAAPTTFESAIGKLTQLGCRAGMPEFDRRTHAFRAWFQTAVNLPAGEQFEWTPFLKMLVSAFLARAGYQYESLVKYAADRLETLYQFTSQGRYDLYVDPADYPGIPKVWQGRPLLDPALTAGGVYHFPTIYDIHLLANFPAPKPDAAVHEKINAVIAYLLHPDYQSLEDGYGIMSTGPRKFYAVGWSVHLPGYFGDLENHRWRQAFVQRMVLMSHFPSARQPSWFQGGLAYLESLRTDAGTYLFPRDLLRESRSGYWVAGAYMGLEENRRSKKALELESTFWMMKIIDRSET